jgi:outer membrane protein assembly factor BamA
MRALLSLACLWFLLLAQVHAAAQNVAEVVHDGLPEGVTPDSVTAVLTQKPGAVYDKVLLAADRERLVGRLKDLGYLDADARSTVNFIPSGIRVTYAVKARNRYTVAAVTAEGVPAADLAAIVAAAKIGQETPCTQEVIDRVVPAIAPKLGVNVLYIEAEWKPQADKKQAVLVLRK